MNSAMEKRMQSPWERLGQKGNIKEGDQSEPLRKSHVKSDL